MSITARSILRWAYGEAASSILSVEVSSAGEESDIGSGLYPGYRSRTGLSARLVVPDVCILFTDQKGDSSIILLRAMAGTNVDIMNLDSEPFLSLG